MLTVLFLAALFFFGRTLSEAQLPAYRNVYEGLDKSNIQKQQKQLKEKYTALQERNFSGQLMTGNFYSEQQVYRQVLLELEQILGYEEYLENVEKNAKRSSTGLLGRQKSTVRTALKIQEDFLPMQDIEVEPLPTRGITCFMETGMEDFLILIAVFVITAALISVETEEGTLLLLRCTEGGRKSVIYAKYLAGSLFILVFCVVLYLARLGGALLFGGVEVLSGAMQSLYGAEGCVLSITIGQGIFLFFLWKLFAVTALYSVILTLAFFVRQPKRIYIFVGGPTAALWAAYTFIDENSWLALLKWLNPIAFLDTRMLLLNYRNILLFDYPVTYWKCMLVCCAVLTAAAVLCLRKLFLAILPGSRSIGTTSFHAVMERCVAGVTGKYTLMGFEFRKWAFYQNGGMAFFAFLGILFFLYHPVAEQIYEESEIYYRYYVKQVEGGFSEEKMQYLRSEQERLLEIRELLRSGMVTEPYLKAEYSKELKKEEGLLQVIEYAEYLESTEDGAFIYEQGYERLFGMREPADLFLYRVLGLAAVTFFASMICGVEERTGMKQLIQISFTGSKKIGGYKYANVLLAGGLVFLAVYLPWMYNVFSVYGTAGSDAPCYSLWRFDTIPEGLRDVSAAGMLGIYYGMHLLYLWVMGIAAAVLTDRMKNSFLAAFAAFGIGMVPILFFGMN